MRTLTLLLALFSSLAYASSQYVKLPPASSGGGGTPGGSNTQVQFNDSSAFGGSAGLVYNKATSVLTVGGNVLIPGGTTAAPGLGFTGHTNSGFRGSTDFGGTDYAPELVSGGTEMLIANKNTGAGNPFLYFGAKTFGQDGSASEPSLGFWNQGGVGIYRDGSNSLSVSTSSTQRAYFNTAVFGSLLPVELKEVSTPSNPAAGFMRVYPKSGDILYSLDSSGAEKQLGFGAWSTFTPTITASSVNPSAPSAGWATQLGSCKLDGDTETLHISLRTNASDNTGNGTGDYLFPICTYGATKSIDTAYFPIDTTGLNGNVGFANISAGGTAAACHAFVYNSTHLGVRCEGASDGAGGRILGSTNYVQNAGSGGFAASFTAVFKVH